ncbi:hypothetical protein ACIOG8_27515 [Streptomyces erythrochromogenes]|uniref:hypothetical protein n=1 Tax=Streptomyces erythrochromogenes TaxID=285574 RepID=UPI00381EAA55
MPSRTTALPPYVVPCAGAAGYGAARYALVGADGRLVRAPDPSAVGCSARTAGAGSSPPPPTGPYTEAFEDDGLSRFQAADGHWGFAGTDGTPVIPATLTEAGVCRHGPPGCRPHRGRSDLAEAENPEN